jgi:hypothetical protein
LTPDSPLEPPASAVTDGDAAGCGAGRAGGTPDEAERVRAAGLRRVAVASVAALALVLPLAVAVAGAEHPHGDAHHRGAGQSAAEHRPASPSDED